MGERDSKLLVAPGKWRIGYFRGFKKGFSQIILCPEEGEYYYFFSPFEMNVMAWSWLSIAAGTPNMAAVITISTAISTSSTAVMSSSTAVTPDRSDTEACHKYGLEHLRIERERLTNLLPAHTLDFALKHDEVQHPLSKLRRNHEHQKELPVWYVSGFKKDFLKGVYRCRDDMPMGGQPTNPIGNRQHLGQNCTIA